MAPGMIPVRVAIRVRPLSGKERQEGCENALKVVDGRPQIALLNCDKAFTYDFAFDSFTPQNAVFDKAVDPLIGNLFKGYNVTVLAYGQTGSGKTYTMGTSRSTITPTSDTQEGVIARAVDKIFNKIDALKVHYEFKVRVAFVELYKEDLCDLLCTKGDGMVDIREHPDQGVYIANLTELPIGSSADMFDALVKGSSRRQTAATNMNSVSSRSHAIFTIFIEGTRRAESIGECGADGNDSAMEGMPDSLKVKFHMVDLAGSERLKKTGATGERQKEGVAINMGLLSLGNVIAALGEENGPRGHISYRDSKLTRLLQDSLGGNSHTLMIACVSPADSNIEESLNTLRYADRARKIKNKPIVNRGSDKEEVLRLRKENSELKLQLMQGGGGALSGIEAQELKDLREKVPKLLRDNKDLTAMLKSTVAGDLSMNGADIAEAGAVGGASSECDEEMDQEAHDRKQANMQSQLQSLNDMLSQKEALASNMMANEEKMQEMRDKYEKSIASLQEELATKQQEKDKLDIQTKSSKNNDPTCKISEQRRKRIQDLENQMSDLRKKVSEQSRALKDSQQTEKQAKKLAEEISVMKNNKVKLIKQMKEDAEKNRVWKQAKEKEVAKLKQEGRKQQVQIAKMETMHVKQQNVMKRKMEEASMKATRLQELIDRQKNAKKSKPGTTGKSGLLGATERVKSMVNHELDIATTVKDAQQSRDVLMTNRAELNKQLTNLRSQSRLTMTGSDRTKMDKRRKELQTELDAANAQIQSLTKQIMEAEKTRESEGEGTANGKPKSWVESIPSMSEAKVALQYLFDKVTDSTSHNAQLKSEKAELKVCFAEATNSVNSLEIEIAQLKREKQEMENCKILEIDRLKTDYEEQKSLLLSKLTNPDFDVKEADMKKYTEFHDKLKKTMKKPKPKMKVKDEDEDDNQIVYLEDEEEEEEEDSGDDEYDYEEDPDWQQTPLFRRLKSVKHNITKPNNLTLNSRSRKTMVLPGNSSAENSADEDMNNESTDTSKRKSSTLSKDTCQCKKSGCKTNQCACRKGGRTCGEACKCVGCHNAGPGANNRDDDVNGIDNTAGTASLLSATFDISDVKENLQPPSADHQPTPPPPRVDSAEPPTPGYSRMFSPNTASEVDSSPKKNSVLATPLSKYAEGQTRRKTIFQSPLSEANDSPVLSRPLFKTPMTNVN